MNEWKEEKAGGWKWSVQPIYEIYVIFSNKAAESARPASTASRNNKVGIDGITVQMQ
jgi:hypothetical protein